MSGTASPDLSKPPLIITSRLTSSGRCIAVSMATTAPSLWPTRSAGFPTTCSRKAIVSSAISW
jgi:hypothetical protein